MGEAVDLTAWFELGDDGAPSVEEITEEAIFEDLDQVPRS